MSTRCRIGIEHSNGEVHSIYCHHDGYPEGVGRDLEDYWQDTSKVIKLIERGDISALDEDIDNTEFYTDRGSLAEENLSAVIHGNAYEYLGYCKENVSIEYTYLYKYGHDITDYKWIIFET